MAKWKALVAAFAFVSACTTVSAATAPTIRDIISPSAFVLEKDGMLMAV
jgi:hypothetical protein